jgi:hypothetical protein
MAEFFAMFSQELGGIDLTMASELGV